MARPIPATCKPPITALRSRRALRTEQVADHPAQHGDLGQQLPGQLPQGGYLPGIRLRQPQLIQPCRPGHPEDIGAGDRDTELGQHGVDLVLAAGPQPNQLLPAAGELSQVADLARGVPRLGQPAHCVPGHDQVTNHKIETSPALTGTPEPRCGLPALSDEEPAHREVGGSRLGQGDRE
jgi:hypothetical protein